MTVYPNLGYRDAQAAIRFLVKAFGFHRAYVVEDGEGGPIAHARLEWPAGGAVTLHSAPGGSSSVAHLSAAFPEGGGYPPFSIHVDTDDPDAVFARVVRAGAAIVREIQDSPHGTRGFVARDPELGVHDGKIGTFDIYLARRAPWTPVVARVLQCHRCPHARRRRANGARPV